MTIDSYCVGLVINQSGLNDNQSAWISKQLKWISSNLEPSSGHVVVIVVGFNGNPDNHHGLPRHVWNKTLPPRVKLEKRPGHSGASLKALQSIRSALAEVDEVWCCPSATRAHLLNPARPNVIYRTGQQQMDHHRYKWVPPWVSVDDFVNETLKGKGVKNGKKAIGIIRGYA